MYTLFYLPGACSMAVHVALNEIGAPVELKNAMPDGKTKDPEFLKINPRGTVPALLDSGLLIREGAAQLIYLLDKHGKTDLLPKEGPARAAALEWLMWCNASLHPAYGRAFWVSRTVTDATLKQTLMQDAVQKIEAMWVEADQWLGKHPFLAGQNPTIADILMTVIANWAPGGSQIKLGENVKRVLRAVIARPAYQKALASEKVDYKAAA